MENSADNKPNELHTLMLMRHGKYNQGTIEQDLSYEGIDQVKTAARTMASKGYCPDAIVHSPLKRAIQTAELMKKALKDIFHKEIPLIKEINLIAKNERLSEEKYKALFDSFGQEAKTILAVTHEPNIENLTTKLIGREISPSTAEIVVLQENVRNWQEFQDPQLKARLG